MRDDTVTQTFKLSLRQQTQKSDDAGRIPRLLEPQTPESICCAMQAVSEPSWCAERTSLVLPLCRTISIEGFYAFFN